MAENVLESAKGLTEVSTAISGFSNSFADTAQGTKHVKTSAAEQAKLSENLKQMLCQFKV